MRARAETFALSLVVALPLLVYVFALRHAALPRWAINGDYAGLILATKMVWTGKVLVGPYSRFGFSHPGPLYFFALWPWWALSGKADVGIFIGACATNILAAVSVVGGLRIVGGRAHGLAALLGVLAWEAAFGSVVVQPWNPLVIVLPMIAFFVLAAMVLRGEIRAAAPALACGAFVAQTHVSTVPTIVAVGAVALGYALIAAKRQGTLSGRSRKHLALAGAVMAVALLPMVVDQLSPTGGNLGKLARFFLHRPEPTKPFAEAFKNWAYGMSWLPDRLFEVRLRDEGMPRVMASEALPSALSPTALHWTYVFILAVLASSVIAYRRRDQLSLAILGVSALGMLTSFVSLRGVVAETSYYLVFWVTSVSTTALIGVLATLFGAAEAALARFGGISRSVLFGTTALLVAVPFVSTVALQRSWVARNTMAMVPGFDWVSRDLYSLMRERVVRDGGTPVIHNSGIWHLSLSHVLEFSRDGFDVRVPERDQWILGHQFDSELGAARPVHIYTTLDTKPLPYAACLERLGKIYDVDVYVSSRDVLSCP